VVYIEDISLKSLVLLWMRFFFKRVRLSLFLDTRNIVRHITPNKLIYVFFDCEGLYLNKRGQEFKKDGCYGSRFHFSKVKEKSEVLI
jgi:hypothetical protein